MIQRKFCLLAAVSLLALTTRAATLTALDAQVQDSSHDVVDDGSSHAVRALFDLDHPDTGPFPSDVFTVRDATHNTGRRVNLPYPDCSVRVSDCEDLDVINTLDGFGLQTRMSIPFDGAIDPNTVDERNRVSDQSRQHAAAERTTRRTGWSGSTRSCGIPSRTRCTSNPTSCSPNTPATRSSSPMACATTAGGRWRRARAFRRFRQTVRGNYKQALLEAIHAARHLGVRERDIVTASVYTTQSITSVMERIRDQIKNAHAASREFPARSEWRARGLQPGGRDKHRVEPAHESEPSWLHHRTH